VDINRRSGNEDWLGKNYDNIGTIYLQLGDHPEALKYMLQALALREQIGDKQLTNMVTVGALLAALPEVTLETLEAALKAHLPARHQHLLPKNYEALRKGYEAAKQQLAVAV
jgi:Pyruvate/2-oxoacid:ferredoxin oxidoreductase gamma subunit